MVVKSKRKSSKKKMFGGKPKSKEILFITGNQGKINEVKSIIEPYNIIIKSKDIDLPEIQSVSVEEVIKHKVETAYKILKKPLIVEDTGLYITSSPMNGFPGALIKFYFKKLGLDGICEKNGGDETYVETIIGYHDGKNIYLFKGKIEGTIPNEPKKGEYGFGWDSIFIPKNNNEEQLSFAQLTPEQKNKMSMRKLATMEMVKHLNINYV